MTTCFPVVLLMLTIESTTIRVRWATLHVSCLSGTWARLVRVFDFLAVFWRISPPNRYNSPTKGFISKFIDATRWCIVIHKLWYGLDENPQCSYHSNGTLRYTKYVQIQPYNEWPIAPWLLKCRSCCWCSPSRLQPYASVGPLCTSVGFLGRQHDWCGFSTFWR